MATITVTNLYDSGDGSLRSAIAIANASSDDTIDFAANLAGGTLTLTSGELDITSNITIDGDSSSDIAIDGNNNSRVFDIDNGNAATTISATLDNLVIQHGYTSTSGGGILVGGSDILTLINSTVTRNYTSAFGGGIYGLTNALIGLTDVTVSGNTAASSGGGISGSTGGVGIVMTNTTVSGNHASLGGGGIYGGTDSFISLTDTTVSGNETALGAGIFNSGSNGYTVLTNSIVAGNFAAFAGPDLFGDSNSSLAFTGGNIVGSAPLYFGAVKGAPTAQIDGASQSDLKTVFASVGKDPHTGILSGLLADNGGPVQTIALAASATNPALDAGNDSLVGVPTTDARGLPRADVPGVGHDGSNISDLGAFELQPETPSLIVTTANDVVDPFDGLTSLREALAFANSNPNASTITFDPSLAGDTLTLTQGELDVASDITIDGDIDGNGTPDIAIDANNASRVFDVAPPNPGTVTTLDGLVIEGGNAYGPLGTGTGTGGGIYAGANDALTISNSVVSDNKAFEGGGVEGYAVTVIDSTIEGNFASTGGGLAAKTGGSLAVVASTVSGNTAQYDGGGISADPGVALTMIDSTVAENSGANAGGGIFGKDNNSFSIVSSTLTGNDSDFGGGVYSASGSLTLTNSIVAGDVAAATPASDDVDVPGSQLTYVGHNVLGSAAVNAGSTDTTNGNATIAGTDPTALQSIFASVGVNPIGTVSGLLADNGGLVETVAINSLGIAHDTGVTADLPTDTYDLNHNGDTGERLPVDARGESRVSGNSVDVGAFEVQNTATPTNLVVTTLDDEPFDGGDITQETADGNGLSLREAIGLANAAGGSHTITFDPSLAGGTLYLTNGELDISSNVTIDGDIDRNGVADIAISADNAAGGYATGRVFNIGGNATSAVLDGLIIEDGVVSSSGGGISVTEGNSLMLSNSDVVDNVASSYGGGISGIGAGITIINSTVADNDAGYGGGLSTYNGSLALANSAVYGNSAQQRGGGILGRNADTITLTNTTVSGNSAVYGSGGGISGMAGASILPGNQTVTLYDSTLTGNSAAGSGGGIYNPGNGSVLTLSNSIVTGNAASLDNDVAGANSLVIDGNNIFGSKPGGSFFVNTKNGSYTTIDGKSRADLEEVFAHVGHDPNTGVLSGVLAYNGGPVSTVALNPTGIAIDAGSNAALPLDTYDLNNNGNTGDQLPVDARDFSRAVGSSVDIGAFEQQAAQSFVVTTLTDELDSTNPNATLADMEGGTGLSLREALFLANEDPTTADTITFAANLAGGMIGLDPTLGQLTIDGNVTIDGSNDNITVDAQGNSRVFDALYGTSTINGLTMTDGNAAGTFAGDGGAIQVGTSKAFGGAALTVSNSTITDSLAAYGGGIAVNAGDSLQLTNSTVSSNSAYLVGGGIANQGTLTLTNSMVANNSSGYIGGGIASDNTLTVIDSTLSGNQTIGGPGAVIPPGYGYGGGGGLYNSGSAALLNTTIANNKTGYSGGGIYNSSALTLTNVTIAENSAYNGGGLFNAACGCGNVAIYDATITGNDATEFGGGIYNANGSLSLTNSIVAGNDTLYQGADIAASATATTTYSGVNLFSQAGVGRAGVDIYQPDLTNIFVTGTLGNYGGPVATVLIAQGGDAEDAGDVGALPPDTDDLNVNGNTAEPLPVDARGDPRVVDGTLDLGAVELQGPRPVISNPDAVIAAAGTGPIALYIAAPTDSDGSTPIITLDTVPTYGTTQYFDGTTFVTASDGTMLTPAELASLDYTPPPSGEFGGQTISYTATDDGAPRQGTIAVTVLFDDTGPSNLYFSAFGGPGNGGNPDLFTLDQNGNPLAIPLNVANGSSAGEDGGFFQFAGDFYFFASSSTASDALFEMAPDGTVTLVGDGNGGFYGDPGENAHVTEFDGSLYFEALSNAGGDQLVKLNADGTSQTIVLNANGQEAFPGQNGGFVEFDGDLYFSAVTTTTNGFGPNLIQLDPNGNITEISTRSPANAAFGSNAGEDGGFYVFDNALYFNATSGTLGDTLFELTAGSTTPVPVDPNGAVLSHTDGIASGFHEFDGSLYFNEQSTALSDDTLFKLGADGTLTPLIYFNGTTDEALEGAGGSGGFADFAGSTYFVANTQDEGTQLFKLDSAGNISEITNTAGGGAFNDDLPGNFVVFNDNLYFDAYSDAGGDSLYQLSANGTLTTVNLGIAAGFATDAGVDGGFQVVNNNLYFSAETPSGYELVRLGADGTVHEFDINPGAGNNSFDTGGGSPANALGAFPQNIINGTAGNDILVGSTPDEIINGGSGNDVIEGRGGNDILTGGAGTNDFVFSAAGPANVDTVTNYSLAQGDILDVSALIDANFTAGSQIVDFVRLIASGNDLILQVDPNGSADNPHVWQDVAILDNADVAAVNQVTAFIAGADHTITQTTDFTAPTVQSVVFQSPGGTVGQGTLVTVTVDMSEAAMVETAFGSPTLGLNDGGTATFDAADSTSTALVFDYTVLAGQNASALATSASGVSLNGGTIEDLSANEADLTASDNVTAVPTIVVNTIPPTPVVTAVSSNVNATPSETFTPGQLFSTSAPVGYPILSYEVEDENSGANRGFWVLNGAVLPNGQLTTITAAQLSALSFVAGSASTPVSDTLEVAASDAAGLGAFTTFTVTAAAHAPTPPPTVTAANELQAPNLSLAGSSLFSGTAFGNNTITSYEVEDTTTDSGHWMFNGVVEPTNQVIDVTVAQLSQLSFDTGYGSDTLKVRANDGTQWGSFTTFTVTPPPNAPPPAGTADTLVMLRNADGAFEFYDIGHNTILLDGPLGQINPALQVAGVGGFNGSDTADLLMRDPTTGVFTLYDVSNNNITGNVVVGQVGLEWTVSGLGDFSTRANETDMLMRNCNTGQFEVYDIANNAITFAGPMGQVGLEWSIAGFGDFSTRANETDMLMHNSNTGAFEVYDIVNNTITSFAPMGQVGLEWTIAGFGDFSTRANETDMLMRNSNTGAFEVYDVVNNTITSFAPMGQVGLEWTIAGFGDFSGNANETDMLMRNSNTGVFELYDINNNTIAPMTTQFGQVGLEWSISGVSATPASAPPTTQLTQAMASFAPSAGTLAASSPLEQTMARAAIGTALLTTNHA
jgi:hypothetical protein